MSKQEIKNDPKCMIENFYNSDVAQSIENYDNSHIERYKKTITYLEGKFSVQNSKICDMGCGPGYILKNLKGDNDLVGVDGTKFEDDKIRFYKANLDYENFSNNIPEKDIDHMLCFETIEHLSNPYNFIFECKKMMKDEALFHISYPTTKVQHNTYYPGLLWPNENFKEFMNQMAFELVLTTVMPTQYGGVHLSTYKNLSWENVKMKWNKKGDEFFAQPPHVQINI